MKNYIKELNIISFRALRNVKYDQIGLVNEIYGKNGSGKTTTIEAINFMLSGETLDYGEKDEQNIDEKNPNDIIDIIITLSDGQTLERAYGNKIQENGNVTLVNYFYANGRKCKNQKEYYEYVDNMFNLKVSTKQKINLRSCFMNPYKFSMGVDPKILRKYIEELLGLDVDKKLFDTGKYTKILVDYNKQLKDFQKLMESYRQDKLKTNNDIEKTNDLIERMGGETFDEEKFKALVIEKQSLQQNYKPYQDKVLEDLIKQHATLTEAYTKSHNEDLLNAVSPEEKELNAKIEKLKSECNKNIDSLSAYNNNKAIKQSNARDLQSSIESYERMIQSQRDLKFEELICPHCHKVVNENEEEKFNEQKAEKIKSLESKVISLKEDLEKTNKEYESYKTQYESTYNLIVKQKEQLKEMKSKLAEMQNLENKDIESEKTKSLKAQVNDLVDKITAQKENYEVNKAQYNIEYNDRLANLENQIAQLTVQKNAQDEVLNLREVKKTLLSNLETIEQKIACANEFKKAKIQETKNAIFTIFGDEVDFEFIKEYKSSDNFKEVCYATLKGISYSAMNTANQLQVGVLIIKKLQEFTGGCDLPIVFDISDNIGNKALNSILSNTSNQVFFTCVDRSDEIERQLKVLKEIKGE